MQVDFLTSVISVAIMIALAVPGFILKRRNMLPEKAVAALVAVLIYVSQPFLTIDSFLEKDYRPELLAGMGISFALSLAFHALIYFIAAAVFKSAKAKTPEPLYAGSSETAAAADALTKTLEAAAVEKAADAGLETAAQIEHNGQDGIEGQETAARTALNGQDTGAAKRICIITSFMGNVGFMGIPVMKALFPQSPEMLIYTAVFILGFNIASWTLGVYTVTGDRKHISLRRALLNPPTAALVVALPLFFFKSYIPRDVMTPVASGVGYLSDMTLPLSMLILGIRLADIKFASLFNDAKVYVSCFIKLAAAPLICFGIMFLAHVAFPAFDRSVIITGYIVMAMPSASLTLTFAEMYDGDRQTAVKATILSTILSVITIPLLMLLCNFI